MSVAYFSCTRESFLFRLHPEGTMATIRNAVSYIHDYFRFKNQGESRYDQNLRHHLFHRHVRRHGHKNRMAHLHGHGSGCPVHCFRSASVWQHFRSGRLERSADDLRYHDSCRLFHRVKDAEPDCRSSSGQIPQCHVGRCFHVSLCRRCLCIY